MKKRDLWQIGLVMGLITLLALSGCSAVATSTAVTASAPVATSTDVTAGVPVTSAVASATAASPAATAHVPDVLTVDAEGNTGATPTAFNATTGLSEEEIAGLRFMREEEKLARDVYLTLYETWGTPIFQNIANAEQTHTDAVLTVLVRYGITDPVGDNTIGVFTDPALQALYDQLIAQGTQSLGDALKVGAAIEEIDILDLEERSAQTANADIRQVYTNLTQGSRNHLRSFVQTLARQTGETYTPQYMTQAAYDAILNSTAE